MTEQKTRVSERLLQQVAAAAPEIESLGQIPPPLAQALKAERCFSLLLPEDYGGQPPAFPDYLQQVQALSRADGSTGWCVNQASILATIAYQMPARAARLIWPEAGCSLSNGPPGKSEATAVEGGYLLTGEWSFSSGIMQADYLAGVAPVKENGKTIKVLWCFLPKSSAVVDSSWPVNGLKGTASFGFAVKQLFIPEDMTLAYRVSAANPPLYRMPLNLMFACGFASVALGVSRGALDFAIRRTREKTKRFDRGAMSTHESVQVQVGRAEALWQSADTFLTHRVRQVWDDLVAGSPLTDEHRISMRMVGTHVIRQCKDVTDIAYAQCSTDSIFTGNEIQRRFQDMHVITQHLQGRPEVYGVLGRYYLGEPFDSPLIS